MSASGPLAVRFGAFRRATGREGAVQAEDASPASTPNRSLAPQGGAWAELGGDAALIYHGDVAVSIRVVRRIPRPAGLSAGRLGSLRPALRPAQAPSGRRTGAGDPRGHASMPGSFLWFDLETTGLGAGAGVKAFLVGVLRDEAEAGGPGNGLLLVQHVLPDFDRLPGFLAEAGRDLADAVWVTHNGRAFDLPLWEDLHVLAGLRAPRPAGDLDLLPLARQIWRERLGSVTLARLRRDVLGAPRVGDPGAGAMPETYLAFLATGDPLWLAPALAHNAEDLLALFALTHLIAQAAERPPDGWPTADLLGLARLLARWGLRPDDALAAAVRAARSPGERARALSAAGRLLKRRGDHAQAACHFERAVREAPIPSPDDLLELAKHYEHRACDLPRALAVTERAIGLLRVVGPPLAVRPARHGLEAWQRRRLRLLRRLGQAEPLREGAPRPRSGGR